MKRKIVPLILVLMLVLSYACVGYADDKEILITIDGVTLQTADAPFLYEGTTMVPMRSIFEALGATVEWNNETKSITARKGLTKIDMAILKYELTKNNIAQTTLLPPVILDGTTYVPARAVAEAMKATVEWKDGNVIITSNTTGYEEYPTVPDFGKMYNKEVAKVVTEDEVLYGDTKIKAAAFGYLYALESSQSEYVTKYKELLLQKGYKFVKTVNSSTGSSSTTTYYYNYNDKSSVHVIEYEHVVGINVSVMLSLEDLNLKATN